MAQMTGRSDPGARSAVVVDDDPSIRSLLSELLRDEGYVVRTADDGAAALAALREEAPDVVLLDLAMPGLDGYDVLAQWKPPPSTHVIVLSASRNLDRPALSGCTVMRKPFEVDSLLCAVNARLQHA